MKVNDRAFTAKNWTDDDGNHQGGQSYGPGFCIAWQRGPMQEHSAKNQNGALLITVLSAIIHQVEYFQDSKFACNENEQVISLLKQARDVAELRRDRRKAEGTLGTHKA